VIAKLLAEIERVTPDGGEWCDIAKAGHLAALVLGLRPRTIVEIGVFLGGSLVPMALAQRSYATPEHHTLAIDPWAADASAAGQIGVNLTWWRELDHQEIYERFRARLRLYSLEPLVQVLRQPADAVTPPARIDLLHIDGNHGEQAYRDVCRFAPCAPVGGILVLDDLDWSGGGVRRGYEHARGLGFEELYKLGTGCVMQRRAAL
jgi:predicted O-methyltransferase YrrM